MNPFAIKKIHQIMPAPKGMRAAMIPIDDVEGFVEFTSIDFLALVEQENGSMDVLAMYIEENNGYVNPAEYGNFVAICGDGESPDPETVESCRRRIRNREAKQLAKLVEPL